MAIGKNGVLQLLACLCTYSSAETDNSCSIVTRCGLMHKVSQLLFAAVKHNNNTSRLYYMFARQMDLKISNVLAPCWAKHNNSLISTFHFLLSLMQCTDYTGYRGEGQVELPRLKKKKECPNLDSISVNKE